MIKKLVSLIYILIVWLLPVDLNTFSSSIIEDIPFDLTLSEKEKVEAALTGMTLKEKCAQLIISYATSLDTAADSEEFLRLIKLVEDYKVGGIILFQGDVEGHRYVINTLQSRSKIPLLFSTDFERGLGTRLEGCVEYPHNMAFGAMNNLYYTYLMGKYVAIESRALGIHQNYAPILDVNRDYRNPIINTRSYSENPNIISWHGNAFIKGMHEGHMITTAKHFPGHGATDMDSHSELPLVGLTKSDFNSIDFIPFIESFNAGVKSVMIGHLEIPAFESKAGLPASLSKNIVTELLKNEMSFEGLVITDAMNMKAVVDSFDQDEAAKLAVLAGNDMVLFPANDSLAIEGIYNAVLSGEISEETINNSVRKILTAKEWLKNSSGAISDSTALYSILMNKSHRRLAQEIAEKSITLIKDEQNILPVGPDSYRKVTYIALDDTELRNSLQDPMRFEMLVEKNFERVKSFRINWSTKSKEYSKALNSAKQSDLIILSTYLNSFTDDDHIYMIKDEQKKLIEDLYLTGRKLLVVNFNNPYLLSEIPFLDTYLCSFSTTEVSQKAMFSAISGITDIEGKLPISIPGTEYNIGFGIDKKVRQIYNSGKTEDSLYNFVKVDSLMNSAIADSVFPGSVLLIGHRKRIVYHKPFGRFTYDPNSTEMTNKAIFDLASVSKVMGTTSAAMLLYDRGELNLDDYVIDYLPRFNNNGKDQITIRHLLVHNSGLPAFKRYYDFFDYGDEVIYDIMNTGLVFEPGTDYTYSDLGMITLQLVIEKITGQSLDEFLKTNLFDKLELDRIMYNPPPELWYYCVPTEVDKYWRYTTVKGKVHDENAHLLGGVAGHAGLFSTAEDLSKIMSLYVNDGLFNDEIIFNPQTIKQWTSKQTNYGDRGLGWDTKSIDGYSSAGSKFSANSFGHTGFTGTSIWVDKERGLFVILLTNKVHPTRDNRKIIQFRPLLHDAVIDAVDYY